jgi:hypothetical protein
MEMKLVSIAKKDEKLFEGQTQWLISIIPEICEAEIGRIAV